MTPGLVVIDTGSANLASIRATFRRLGVPAATTRDPDVARRAARAVMPGVGAFGAVMARLTESGMAESIRERVEAGRPLLAVCLGLQLLARGSEEAPAITGLGVLPADARRYPRTSVVPQLGWNRVLPDNREGLVREGHAFFANSYYVDVACDGWTPSWATHDVRFIAALERGPQLACQFHPELSGAWGAALLDRWYRAC